jgi:chromosome segregation ATPase
MFNISLLKKSNESLKCRNDRLTDDYDSLDAAYDRISRKLTDAERRIQSLNKIEDSEKILKAENDTLKLKILSLDSQVSFWKAKAA